ncbi:MAG: hypothetical protein H6741_21805 [Alphaproteobacteria bacterium]|nr:hypothetical protein [Alphaproteobacteria bacterium]
MAAADHRVRRLRVTLRAEEQAEAFSARASLRAEWEPLIAEALSRAMDAHGPRDVHLSTLSLHVTLPSLEEMPQELPVRVEAAARAELTALLDEGRPGAASAGSPGEAGAWTSGQDDAALEHYLSTGGLPWPMADDWEAATQSLRVAARRRGVTLLRDASPVAAFRLLELLPEAERSALVEAAWAAPRPSGRGPWEAQARPDVPPVERGDGSITSSSSDSRNTPTSSPEPWALRHALLAALSAVPPSTVAAQARLAALVWLLKAWPGSGAASEALSVTPPAEAGPEAGEGDVLLSWFEALPEALRVPMLAQLPPGRLLASAVDGPRESLADTPRGRASQAHRQASPDVFGPSKSRDPELPEGAGATSGRELAAGVTPSSVRGPPSASPEAPRPSGTATPDGDAAASRRAGERLPQQAEEDRPGPGPLGAASTLRLSANDALSAVLQQATMPPSDWARAPGFALPVPYAGLVLLQGFLPTFLRRCGFELPVEAPWPEATRARAAALLHHLATGAAHPREFELPLIKVLLGLRPEAPLPITEGLLRDANRAQVSELLNAVISHWSVLKRTSPEGLQRSFLQRPGLLRDEDAGWRLKVEPSGVDVLLARLPWGLSVCKHVWMSRPLFTEWGAP